MKSRLFRRNGSRRGPLLALVVLAAGLVSVPGPATADNGPLPNSCKPHTTHLVNPGCVPAVLEDVGDLVADAGAAVEEATGYDITYPDLVPNVTEVLIWRPWIFDEATQRITFGAPVLAFDTHAQNLGDVPVDLLASDLRNPATSTVEQCVAWTTNYVCRERVPAGGFSWHPEHSHFHYNDFAEYQFRKTLADGAIDYSAAGLLNISEKVSFCLMDSQRVRDDALLWRYTQCDSTNQGISAGWTDVYGWTLPGQDFPLTGVPDGRYALIVDMNTAGNVLETDATNNRVEVIIDVATNPDSAVIVSVNHP